MSYRISIVEVTEVPATERPWRTLNTVTGQCGYVQPAEGATKKIERDVLSQDVETLDLAAVIKAINNL